MAYLGPYFNWRNRTENKRKLQKNFNVKILSKNVRNNNLKRGFWFYNVPLIIKYGTYCHVPILLPLSRSFNACNTQGYTKPSLLRESCVSRNFQRNFVLLKSLFKRFSKKKNRFLCDRVAFISALLIWVWHKTRIGC